jgi:HAD superfamily hydrolase (TIGR01509 family)
VCHFLGYNPPVPFTELFNHRFSVCQEPEPKDILLIRGLIFDFDGLILDTEGPVYQAWLELYTEFGCKLPMSEWGDIIGTADHFDPLSRLEERAGRGLDRSTLTTRHRQRETELIAAQQLSPGVEDYIAAAKALGLHLAIASSSDRNWVVGHLSQRRLLDYFDVVHCREDVPLAKPDPALYHLALESLGLLPDQAIVLEDSSHGVTAAKQAGIFTVAVPNPLTQQLPLDHADLRLESLADLPLRDLIKLVESGTNQTVE